MEASHDSSISSLISAQRARFATGELRDVEYRRSALKRLELGLIERREQLLEALEDDLGKPAAEAFLSEYYFVLQELRLMQKKLRQWAKPRRVASPIYFQPCRSYWQYEAFGVVAVFAPWNYPLQLSLSPVMGAVAAGNTVILKPSEYAPASTALLNDLIEQVFPRDWVAVLEGDAEVAEELLEQKLDHIFFTGSTEVGKSVAKKAAENLTPAVLELGGKCPCVVDASAKVEVAASRILAGKFFNAGQTCFAPDFVAVHASHRERLLEAMRAVLDEVPYDVDSARIINERHYERLQKLTVGEEIRRGEDDKQSLMMAPRVLIDCDWDSPAMQHEVFGPILPIVSYDDEEELRQRLAAMGSPLALYLFAEDTQVVERFVRGIRSGGVCVNDTMKQGSQLGLPFGGVGDSGFGRYRGEASLAAFSYQRAYVKRASWAPSWMEIKPPYDAAYAWLKRFLK